MIHNHEVESSSLSLATTKRGGVRCRKTQSVIETSKNLMQLSGCSSARLEYTSGGRGVAGSNPVIPTNRRGMIINIIPLFLHLQNPCILWQTHINGKQKRLPLWVAFLHNIKLFYLRNFRFSPSPAITVAISWGLTCTSPLISSGMLYACRMSR